MNISHAADEASAFFFPRTNPKIFSREGRYTRAATAAAMAPNNKQYSKIFQKLSAHALQHLCGHVPSLSRSASRVCKNLGLKATAMTSVRATTISAEYKTTATTFFIFIVSAVGKNTQPFGKQNFFFQFVKQKR